MTGKEREIESESEREERGTGGGTSRQTGDTHVHTHTHTHQYQSGVDVHGRNRRGTGIVDSCGASGTGHTGTSIVKGYLASPWRRVKDMVAV